MPSDCTLLRRISARGQSLWVFQDDENQVDALKCCEGVALKCNAILGEYLVATRTFRKGEVILTERPILEADASFSVDWAEPMFRAFCAATSEQQARVLRMYTGEHAVIQGSRMLKDISIQVERSRGKPWRQGVSDETLKKVCFAFNLNAYPSGPQDSRSALYPLGAKLAHSCDSNVIYSWSTEQDHGHGCFLAKHDIGKGETLSTNYLGDMGRHLSAPARRDILLDTKLFVCHCPRCVELGEDIQRRIPCPRCHPRGSDGLLPRVIAFPRNEGRTLSDGSTFKVQYVTPRRAAAGANASHTWGPCSSCTATFDDTAVLPGGKGTGGLCGRSSERVIEQYVQGLLAQLATVRGTGGEELRLHRDDQLGRKMQALQSLVARRVGAKHWASVRMQALMKLYGVSPADER